MWNMSKTQIMWKTVWSPTRERERDVRTNPWQEVAVDLIGPWSVEIRDKWYEFSALIW